MFRFRSIISRILWLHVVVVGGASVLMPVALYWLLVSETNRLHEQSMNEQADRLAHHLAFAQDRWELRLPESMRDLYSEAYGRYSYAVLDSSGAVLFSSHEDRSAIFADDLRTDGTTHLKARNAAISGVSARRDIGGRAVWIQVAENMSHRDVLIDDIVSDFFPRVAWITLPILLALLLLDAEIVRRAFAPVLRASQQATEIGPQRTDIRLSLEGAPEEIRPLIAAVNAALDRLEDGYRAQRNFAADVAHELRTPLAILRTRIETLLDRPVTERLVQDVEAMTRIVGQLLEMAELETVVVGPGEYADLHVVCAEAIEFLAPMALAQDKTIALIGSEEPVPVSGNAEMLSRAMRNLIENAIKHTPAGTSIDVVLESKGTVHVRDNGPGIPEGESELLFRRFWRRDRKGAGSVGLGLAIVQRITEVHGGHITAANRPEGGAEFSLTVPRARMPAPALSRACVTASPH